MEIKELFRIVLAVLMDFRVPAALLGVFIFILLIAFICDSDKRSKNSGYTGAIKTIRQKRTKQKSSEGGEEGGETETGESEE